LLEFISFFIFGLLWGSFANVVIVRWPKGESFVHGRSHCPQCSELIRWWQNIPVLSFVLLRGRCFHCKAKISWRYPLVEILMGLLFGCVYLRFGWSWTSLEALIFVFGLVTVSFIDLDHMLLPDIFTLSGVVIGLIGAALNPERSFLPALLGAVVGGGILWAVAVLYYVVRKEEGLGGGDIKLLAWIGAVLGLVSLPVVIIFASLWGSFFGVALALIRRSGMRSAIPFGPYLALGALYFMFFGPQTIEWYLDMILPH
jgi:leader peptidase (prepilin peptidase)/N-methyltransferase